MIFLQATDQPQVAGAGYLYEILLKFFNTMGYAGDVVIIVGPYGLVADYRYTGGHGLDGLLCFHIVPINCKTTLACLGSG